MVTTNSQLRLDGLSTMGNCQVRWQVNNGYIPLNHVGHKAWAWIIYILADASPKGIVWVVGWWCSHQFVWLDKWQIRTFTRKHKLSRLTCIVYIIDTNNTPSTFNLYKVTRLCFVTSPDNPMDFGVLLLPASSWSSSCDSLSSAGSISAGGRFIMSTDFCEYGPVR